jgi:16S rRNA (cytosine967-C5)-methyltransferase
MISSGRLLARMVLDRVEQNESYVNLALHDILASNPQVEQRERAFCTELVYGTLRNLLQIDFILGRLLSRPLQSLKVPVKDTLRLALYQLLFLPEIPERAVCHAAVDQIKNSRYSGLAGLVNAILRNFLRNRAQIPFPDRHSQPVEFLSVTYSHPAWLAERWLKRYGFELAERLMAIDNEKPPLTVRINRLGTSLAAIRHELAEAGVTFTQGSLLDEALILQSLPMPLEELPAFRNGKLFVQDESSMLVAHLLQPAPGATVVDLCAAPGGKSTHLAELMNNCGTIYSIDDHPHKVGLIAENAARLGLKIIEPRLADARSFQPPSDVPVDAILVDAPCSGTGVLRRRVDARYRRQAEDSAELVRIQREILDHAAQLLKSGGRIVYSTCTLEPEENQEQIRWFCQAHPEFRPVPWREYLPAQLGDHLEDSSTPWANVLPASGGGDGFFLCRLHKN